MLNYIQFYDKYNHPYKILLGFSETLGHTLLMDAQNKSWWDTDAHRYRSKLWQLYAELLR